MCFYGLTMVASDIGDNVFLNFSLVLGIELPAILFATYGLDKFGRKPLLAYSQILAGVTLIAAGLLINYDPLIPVSFWCDDVPTSSLNHIYHYDRLAIKKARVSQSHLFPQSCFSWLIGHWPVQAALRE